MNSCMDGYYQAADPYFYQMAPPMMNFGGNLRMPPAPQQNGKRKKKREYFENAPNMYECTIAPVEEQGNKEFEAVRAFAAAVAAVMAIACPEQQKEEPKNTELSPRKVRRLVRAACEKLLQSNSDDGSEKILLELTEILKKVKCVASMQNAAEILVEYGTDYKHIRVQVIELISELNNFGVPTTNIHCYEEDSEGSYVQLGGGSLNLIEAVGEKIVEKIENCCGCDANRLISFIEELTEASLAPPETIKAAVSHIALGSLEYNEYIDPATPQEQITASPPYYRAMLRKIDSTHSGLTKSPYFHDALVLAAHISEFYLPDEEPETSRGTFHAKSSPLPVIEA